MRKAVPITDNIGFPIMRNGDGVAGKKSRTSRGKSQYFYCPLGVPLMLNPQFLLKVGRSS